MFVLVSVALADLGMNISSHTSPTDNLCLDFGIFIVISCEEQPELDSGKFPVKIHSFLKYFVQISPSVLTPRFVLATGGSLFL